MQVMGLSLILMVCVSVCLVFCECKFVDYCGGSGGGGGAGGGGVVVGQ